MNEYHHEPVRGLPDTLPDGEHIIWQGEPHWLSFARRTFHLLQVACYFAALIVAHQIYHYSAGGSLAAGLNNLAWQLGLGLSGLGIIAGLARLYAGTTVYTLTNRRIVLRFGVAIPMMINLPMEHVLAADLREFGDGTGDVALKMDDSERIAYWALWPHARPWHFSPTIPTLRSVPDARRFAARLGEVAREHGQVRTRSTESAAAPGGRDLSRAGALA